MTMSQSEGFHVITRSDMKELFHDVKCMVLDDNHKKSVLFEIRVDVCHRSDNLPEDREGGVIFPEIDFSWYIKFLQFSIPVFL
jgi:hypothetical protein